jgi:spermidine synthase
MVAILVVAVLSAVRFPPAARDPKHGLIETREGATVQYRVVDLEDGRYLLADGTLQTLVSSATGDPQLRPTAALNIIDLFVAPPESMLVLGLRGGSMAKGFARRGWRVRVVEPDPLAIRVASEHLSFSRDEVPVTVADLRVACRRETRRFPVVIVDAFADGPTPFHLVTREFFAEVKRRLNPGGVLALAIASGGWKDPLIASLAATLRTSFRTVLALPTSEPPNTLGSIVLLASDRNLDLPDERLPQPTEFFMNLEEHWSVVQMNHAWFNRYQPPAADAVVLTDDLNPIDRWTDRIQHSSRLELHELFRKTGAGW